MRSAQHATNLRLLVALVLTGCPPPASGPDAGDAGPASISVAEYCVQYPPRLCGLLENCGQLRAEERALCEGIAGEECLEQRRTAQAGRYRYDGFAAARCLASLSTCSVVPDLTTFDCRDIFRAPDFFSATCGPVDCDAGTYCDPNCAQCKPWRTQGETCAEVAPLRFDAACDRALSCLPDDAGTLRCQGRASLGEPCPSGLCSPGAICDQGTCAALLPAGAVCLSDGQCADTVCSSAGTCGVRPRGASCRGDHECGKLYCAGLGPNTLGVCQVRIPTGALCAGGAVYEDGCEESGATCLGGHCTVTAPFSLAEGAECDAFYKIGCLPPYFCQAQCKDGLFCRFDAGSPRGRCSPRGAAGAPCLGNVGACAPGLGCVSMTCQPLGGPGAPCAEHRACKSLLDCAPVADGGRECRTWGVGACVPDFVSQPLAVRHGQCAEGYCAADGGCEPKLPAGSLCTAGQRCTDGPCRLNPGSSQWSGSCPSACF